MTIRELYGVWRTRKENPFFLRRSGFRARFVYPMLPFASACFALGMVLSCRRVFGVVGQASILFGLTMIGAMLILPSLVCLLVWHRNREPENLEELLLTGMSRTEIAWGYMARPCMYILLCFLPWLVAQVYMFSLEWGAMGNLYLSITVSLTTVLALYGLMVSAIAVNVWLYNPSEPMRSFLASAGASLFMAFLLIFLSGITIASFDDVSWQIRSELRGTDFKLGVYGFAIVLMASFTIVLLRLARGVRVGRVLSALCVGLALALVAIGLVELLASAPEPSVFGIIPVPLLLACLEIGRLFRHPEHRVLARADPESYRQASWWASEASGKDEREQVRSAFAELRSVLRVGLDPFLLIGQGLILVGALVLYLLLCMSFFRDDLYNGVGLGTVWVTVILAVFLPMVSVFDISRAFKSGAVPVLKGGVLRTGFVYALAPVTIAFAHFVWGVTTQDVFWSFETWITIVPTALLTYPIGVMVTLLLIPRQRRFLTALLIAGSVLIFAVFYANAAQYSRGAVNYFPEPDGAIATLVVVAMLAAIVLIPPYGIPWAAQRVHRLELQGVERFTFNVSPGDRKPVPSFSSLSVKGSKEDEDEPNLDEEL